MTKVRLATFRDPPPAWAGHVPAALRRRWRIGPLPDALRRLEIGSGLAPSPGYVHVDVSLGARELHLLRSGSHTGLPSGWAREILSCHVIEHIPPPALLATLSHWLDVLAPGGLLTIHTPNATALGRVLAGDDPGDNIFWAAQSAIFGYTSHPATADRPERLHRSHDHTVLFTSARLRGLLAEAGFVDIEDVTGRIPCQHQVDWAPFVPQLCLELQARRAPAQSLR